MKILSAEKRPKKVEILRLLESKMEQIRLI